MAGKERLLAVVKEQVDRAKLMAGNIDVAANHPGGATIASVEACERLAKEAIEQAAHSARIIVSEAGKGA